jgi:hypothetical protein
MNKHCVIVPFSQIQYQLHSTHWGWGQGKLHPLAGLDLEVYFFNLMLLKNFFHK